MARQKAYNEEEVIEKALNLFWRNGYETTSTRMLEKEMGINQFSIYSSFKNKQGVFLESLKLYISKVNLLVDKVAESANGIEAIKQYFYDFVEFTRDNNTYRGCLVVNTVNEFGDKIDELIMTEVYKFVNRRDNVFKQKLEANSNMDEGTIANQINFFSIALSGLAASSKVTEKKFLDSFIETTFKNL